jgi:glycosyltransferase involved in cell wall biosynthesis
MTEDGRPVGEMPSAHTRVMTRRKRLLVFAYACEPGRGSEPGAGWGLVRALHAFADCVVLVGPEHVPAIRRWERQHAECGLSFVEVPECRWTISEPRHRFTRFFVYLDWLRRAHALGRMLHARQPFDLVYHATYSAYWLPTPAVHYGLPSIWGPVGGAVVTPRELWGFLGWRGVLVELIDRLAVRVFGALPASKRACRLATVRVVQNEATRDRLPISIRRSALVLNHALFAELPDATSGGRAGAHRGQHCVFVGALDTRKGARLAVHALRHAAPSVHLDIIGSGTERRSLEHLARRLGVADRTHFRGAQPREEVLRAVRTAAAAVFTGLREEGGLALAEAMLVGTPVVVLAHGGAEAIAACTTDPGRVVLVRPADPTSTAMRIGRAMSHFCESPSDRRDSMLDTTAAARRLQAAVEEACDGATARCA